MCAKTESTLLDRQIPLLAQTTFGPLIWPLLVRPLLARFWTFQVEPKENHIWPTWPRPFFGCFRFVQKLGPQGTGPKGGAPKGGAPKGGPRRVGPRRVGPPRVGPRRVGPRRVGPRRVGPRRVGARNFALFSLSCHIFLSFFPLLGVILLNFGGVFEGRDPRVCTFGVLVLLCEAPAAPKPPGRKLWRESEKKSEILGGPAEVGRSKAQKTRHEQQIVPKSSPIGQGFLGSRMVRQGFGPKRFDQKKWSGPKVVWAKSGAGQKWSGPKVVIVVGSLSTGAATSSPMTAHGVTLKSFASTSQHVLASGTYLVPVHRFSQGQTPPRRTAMRSRCQELLHEDPALPNDSVDTSFKQSVRRARSQSYLSFLW